MCVLTAPLVIHGRDARATMVSARGEEGMGCDSNNMAAPRAVCGGFHPCIEIVHSQSHVGPGGGQDLSLVTMNWSMA